MNGAYYNEHDPFAAAWLRGLIAAGLIAPGHVDERDVQLVQPKDLAGYVQCHFFAGIGGWSLALRLAGWPDSRPVWTGSCPCQPFSSAGKGEGFDDTRHLWPTWFRLIRECRPPVVFGEQVASAPGVAWLDHVAADFEAEAYAFGAADLPAAGAGAPHIRQRLWFVADAGGLARGVPVQRRGPFVGVPETSRGGEVGPLADTRSSRPEGGEESRGPGSGAPGPAGARRQRGQLEPARDGAPRCGCWDPNAWHRVFGMRPGEVCSNASRLDGAGLSLRAGGAEAEGSGCARAVEAGAASGMVDAPGGGFAGCDGAGQPEQGPGPAGEGSGARRMGDSRGNGTREHPRELRRDEAEHEEWTEDGGDASIASGAARDPWADLVWVPCRDGKSRPTQPGIFPLAPRVSGRVALGGAVQPPAAALSPEQAAHVFSATGVLRGSGNSIVPQVAATFIRAWTEVTSA